MLSASKQLLGAGIENANIPDVPSEPPAGLAKATGRATRKCKEVEVGKAKVIPRRQIKATVFKFNEDNCAQWYCTLAVITSWLTSFRNLFGKEYSKTHANPSKQEVRDAYDKLSKEEKQQLKDLRNFSLPRLELRFRRRISRAMPPGMLHSFRSLSPPLVHPARLEGMGEQANASGDGDVNGWGLEVAIDDGNKERYGVQCDCHDHVRLSGLSSIQLELERY
ncbi:hypothetical protein NLJ89_g11263 [Agrocybe chaxingu]|uniref:Uncharacterized protein n=1 Tax=Agrocybe chaxingu TaxID=84603 RepID=A0A9W8MN64_9AGAR|nr:hypothetical protein NLJ89_g11263 [Agrocybe chaxingu]